MPNEACLSYRDRMNIAIIGPGALGGLLGALLFEAGEEVRLVDYRPDRVALLRRQGIRLHTPEGGARCLRVPIGLPEEAGPAELTIVTVKAHQTGAAARDLPRLMAGGGLALTVQNGLGNLEVMAATVGPERLLAGVALLGVTRQAEGEIILAGRGAIIIGVPAGLQGLAGGTRPGGGDLSGEPAWSAGRRRTSRSSCGKNSWST